MYFIGIDIGSTAAKVVVMDTDKIIDKFTMPTGWSCVETSENILEKLTKMGYMKDDTKIVGTGYGRVSIPFANKTVTEVNCNLDYNYYENVQETDLAKDNLMIVNKFYYLKNDFEPEDLVTLDDIYNIGTNNKLRKVAAEAFMKMADAAKLDNISLKNASGYRNYEYQETLYNDYVKRDGKEAADTYSARAGYSEHQTGLATDINQINDAFENTDAFKWLSENAYKYGFILRYPKDKENLTGYKYEPWHYRYVGTSVAKQIYEEDLTFEEYYAYYIN